MACCLTCQFWQPGPHEGCDPVDGYGVGSLRDHLSKLNKVPISWPGICQYHPATVDKRSNEHCSKWVANDVFVDDDGQRFFNRLFEFRHEAQQKAEHLEAKKKIKELRQRLREARAKGSRPNAPPS